MPYSEVNEVNYYYELHGDCSKPALVLISGYAADHSMWDFVLEKLAEPFHVLIFDNQAIGKTTDCSTSLSVQSMAKNTLALINHLGLNNVTIMGFALGGAIAQDVAILGKDIVSKLILISSVPKWNSFAIKQLEKLHDLRKKCRVEDMFALLYHISFSDAFKKNYSLEKYIQYKLKHSNSTGNVSLQTDEQQALQLRALIEFDSRERLSKIIADTTIIICREDELATTYDVKPFGRIMGNKEIIVLECGHGILFENSDLLIKTIGETLSLSSSNCYTGRICRL